MIVTTIIKEFKIRGGWILVYYIIKVYIYKRRIRLCVKSDNTVWLNYFVKESHISVKLCWSSVRETLSWWFLTLFLVFNGFSNFLNPVVNSSIESISAIQHVPKSAIEKIPVDNPVDNVIACSPRVSWWWIGILIFDWKAFGLSIISKL